jgi:hypothetical protein
MAALSRLVSRAALGAMLVQPVTVLGWHRELVRRKWAAFGRLRGPGRPGLSDEVVGLILRRVKDNPKWVVSASPTPRTGPSRVVRPLQPGTPAPGP